MSRLSDIRPAAFVQAAPVDDIVRSLIADELDMIRVVLEDMGMKLCADPEVSRNHLGVLQAIDELSQRHEHLARTLRADDMIVESAGISLESLRLRLQSGVVEQMADRALSRECRADEIWRDI